MARLAIRATSDTSKRDKVITGDERIEIDMRNKNAHIGTLSLTISNDMLDVQFYPNDDSGDMIEVYTQDLYGGLADCPHNNET